MVPNLRSRILLTRWYVQVRNLYEKSTTTSSPTLVKAFMTSVGSTIPLISSFERELPPPLRPLPELPDRREPLPALAEFESLLVLVDFDGVELDPRRALGHVGHGRPPGPPPPRAAPRPAEPPPAWLAPLDPPELLLLVTM